MSTDRWHAALVHSYPTPEHAALLRADLTWAAEHLRRGYYDDIASKPAEVRAYIAEAREHLARLEQMRRRAA